MTAPKLSHYIAKALLWLGPTVGLLVVQPLAGWWPGILTWVGCWLAVVGILVVGAVIEARNEAVVSATPCCDLHGRNCELPSELCCQQCTEARHPEHADGRPCSSPDLSPNRLPSDVEIRVAAEIRAEHRGCDRQGCGLAVLTADDVLAVVHMVEVYARGSAR